MAMRTVFRIISSLSIGRLLRNEFTFVKELFQATDPLVPHTHLKQCLQTRLSNNASLCYH